MMASMEIFGIVFSFGAASTGVLLAGLLSAALYVRRSQELSALLALLAALALAAMLAAPTQAVDRAGELVIASGAPSSPANDALARALLAVPHAGSIALSGHGLRAAQWDDLPARPLRWSAPQGDLLRLDFPRTLALGRSFVLSARHSEATPAWRLQLLAENGQVLAESPQAAQAALASQASQAAAALQMPRLPAALTVSWQPPLAEPMLLQARLLDAAGKTVAQGPVPLQVVAPVPLQIIGRFGAASFDTRALNQLLADSGALLDWQTTLGKGLSRTESASAVLAEPNAQVIDGAWFESLSAPARAALLAQTGQGVALFILGGNASNAAIWQRELALQLAPQNPTTEKEDVCQFSLGGEQLAMPPAALNPAAQPGPGWRAAALDDKGQPWLWQRAWKKGSIAWVGVSDWHRYAISSPAALGQWWQALFDKAAAGATQKLAWQQPDPMPVAGLRTEICAQGANAGSPLHIDGQAALLWQARVAKAETVCAAFLPPHAGWLTLHSGASEHRVYVYAAGDWPQWQQALRQDATASYAARSPEAVADSSPRAPFPSWPFALLCAASMLALWQRERS